MNKAMTTYHKHEKTILNDHIEKSKTDQHCEKSGCLFLAMKAISKMPWTFYCDNVRSETFMKTDPTFGIESNKDNLSFDEAKILHLFNLVHHEEHVESEERIKTAIRAIILLESMKQSGYFKGVTFLPVSFSTLFKLRVSRDLHRFDLSEELFWNTRVWRPEKLQWLGSLAVSPGLTWNSWIC